jgi:hypothetical protein
MGVTPIRKEIPEMATRKPHQSSERSERRMKKYEYPIIYGGVVTREEIIEALRQGYADSIKLAKQKDPATTGFPDMKIVLDHIEKFGLPPKD